jgi:ribosome-binding protein aMBF1 (putative translation factor)
MQTAFKQGPISANDLMSKLAMAKKVINKVENGEYSKGNIDSSLLDENTQSVSMETMVQQKPNMKPVNQPVDLERINNSKLPDAIKQAMINNPIEPMPMISLNETLDMDIIKGAKKLMEQDDYYPKKQPVKNTQKQSSSPQNYSTPQNIDLNTIATIVENTVRRVLDEKLNQILSAQQTKTINENLVLKVGDSIFKGKITGVNKAT